MTKQVIIAGFLVSIFTGTIALTNSVHHATTDGEKIYLKEKPAAFLWDLHDVLLKQRRGTQLKLIAKSFGKWHLFKKLNFQQIKAIGGAITNQGHTEDLIQAAQSNGNPELAKYIIEITNQYDVMPGMPAILKELKDAGYKHYIGSNIGSTALENLRQRPDLKPLFALFNFDKIQTYEMASAKNNNQSITKPHKRFFLNFLNQFDSHEKQPHRFIFVDDRKENVTGAQHIGMHAIHFKNTADFRKKLISMRILPSYKKLLYKVCH